MPTVYGLTGLIQISEGALQGNGAPPASFRADLGQQYFDISTTPPTEYIYNGQTWQTGGNAYATTTSPGIVELATAGEMSTGTSQTLVPAVKEVFDYVNSVAIAGAPAWSETVSGIGQLATTAEAQAGADDTVAMTPLKTAQLLAAPPAIGGTTPAAGAFTTLAASGLASLNGSATILSGGTAINIGSDASADAINLGTGAAARVITIGNVTGATAVNVNTGTGNFAVATTGTGDITLNSADTVLIDSAGILELNSSAGVISIGNDAVAQNINLGTGAAARTITLGNSTGATSVVLNAGTGPVNVGTNAIAHTVTLGNSTGATSVVIDSGTGPINVGTNAIAHTVTIGNVTGATAVNINAGSSGSTWTTTNSTLALVSGTGAINIGTDAAAKTITLGNSTGATSLVLNSGTGAINVGTNAIAHTVTIGNVTGATAVAINAGTGGVALASTGAGDITLNSADTLLLDSAGVLELNSSAGVISIGNDAVAQNINLGTGAAARVITIGNVSGASQVVINSGTAGIQLASTGAGDITLNSADTVLVDSAGILELNSSAGVISIGNDAVAQNINVGTGAAARVITIGNITGATAVNVNAGTGASSWTTTNGSFGLVTGTGAINLGADAAAKTITLGNATGATAVNINAGSGAVNCSTDFNLTSVATKISMNGGAVTDFIGTAVLILGTVTIANTNIAAGDRIFLSRLAANGSVTLGELSYSISAGASFTVTSLILGTPASTQTADVSSFSYIIFRQT